MAASADYQMEMPRKGCFHEIGLNEPKLPSLAQRPVIAEHGGVAGAAFDLKVGPNRQNVFGSQRWLCLGQLSLLHGARLSAEVVFT